LILPEALPNFLGIQSQLWTETATSEELFDRMLMPNMIVFAQRAWGPKETWLEQPTAEAQLPLLNASWNSLVNTIGQRQLPIATLALGQLAFDLPKPGAVIQNGELKVRQQFPGLSVHYTLDGSMPSTKDPLYTEAVKVSESATVTLRTFNEQGRGGNSIQIN
jgi:hexosaminidase